MNTMERIVFKIIYRTVEISSELKIQVGPKRGAVEGEGGRGGRKDGLCIREQNPQLRFL
jgi:hypothetical protein